MALPPQTPSDPTATPTATDPVAQINEIQSLIDAQLPQSQPGEVGDQLPTPDEQVRRIQRLELQLAEQDKQQVTMKLYPEMTDAEYAEMRLAEVNGNTELAESIRIKATKRGQEAQEKAADETTKAMHVEGPSASQSEDLSPPTNLDEGEQRALARF